MALARGTLLQLIDNPWREHLAEMDDLREGIHLRGFAQIDPLVAYKNEGFTMSEDLMNSIWEEFARTIFHVQVEVAPGLRHLEVYTLRGLLTLLWHGPRDAANLVLTCGGGMGSLLGPADGIYHDLGTFFATQGIGTVRVGYGKPNDVSRCVHDLAAAAVIARSSGAR